MPTSVAHQTDAQLGGTLSVLVRQKNDHVTLNALLEELGATTGVAQDEVLLRIYRLVFPHAFAEEAVLWPVMRRVLADGEELTLEVEREHQEVNELVERLDGMGHADPAREAVLDRLVEVLREDVRDEEDELFPRLQERVSTTQLRALGVAWEVLRRTAPTRAHPIVARRPPGNALAAVPLSAIDRLRDLVDLTAHRTPAGVAGALGAVSSRLGSAARRVEMLPIMRRGEDESTRYGESAPGLPLGAVVVAAVTSVTIWNLLRHKGR
jgi:hemerythrin superfamily protein